MVALLPQAERPLAPQPVIGPPTWGLTSSLLGLATHLDEYGQFMFTRVQGMAVAAKQHGAGSVKQGIAGFGGFERGRVQFCTLPAG